MSGPIVRSGPTPQFSKNWESVFGKKSTRGSSTATAVKKKAKKAKPAATPKKKGGKKKKG